MTSFTHEHPRILAFPMMLLILGILAGPAFPVSASEDEHEDHQEHQEDQEHQEGLVTLSHAEMEEFHVGVAKAGSGTILLTRNLPGEVKVNDNNLAHIGPRYGGIVTEVRANVGDTVQKDQILAVVESDETLAPYELKTFIAGTIIHKHMTLGEPVSRNNEGFVVADLGTVWIDITVYQRDLDLIRVGEQATVRAGSGERTITGKISYITPVVDEHTRTATARIVVENHDGRWRPGMFVMAEVITGEVEAEVVVPSTAVHTMDGRSVIFVESGEGFLAQPVIVGRKGKTQMEILSGLETGERYVSVGGFVMKAELGKDSIGEGHGH